MADIAELGLKIDSSQATAGAKALDQLTQSGQKAEQAAKRLQGASTQSSTAVRNAGLNASQAADQMAKLHLATQKTSAAAQTAIGLFRGLVVALAAGGLYSALQMSIKMLSDLGDRMQDTRLGADTLQGLRIGAAEARVSQDELNKALEKFSDVSKQSTTDAKEFYKALSNISPALSDAFKAQAGKEGGQDERLRLIADALKQARTETERYQLAQKALGTDNDRVISMFIRGREALDEYIETARRYGILVDEAFIKKAQDAQRTLSVLSTVIADKLRMAIVDLLPDLQRLYPYIEAIATKIGDYLASFAELKDQPGGTLERRFRAIGAEIDDITDKLKKLDAFDKSPIGIGSDLESRILKLRKEQEDIAVILAGRKPADDEPPGGDKPGFSSRSSLKDSTNAYESQINSIRKHIAAMEADTLAVGKTAGEHARLRVEAQLLEAGLKAGLTPEAVRASEQFRDLAARAEGAANALARARVNDQIKFDSNTAFLSQEDVQIAQQLRDIYPSVADALNSVEAHSMRANAAMRDLTGQISGGLTTALMDVWSGTKSAGDAFREFGITALRALQEMIIKLMIVGPLMRSLQGAFGSGLLGGGIIPGILHEGGLGRDAPSSGRLIHPAYFEMAPRFHDGKLPWGPGEMPAIIKPEEEILTTRDPRHRWNGGGKPQMIGINVNVSLDGAKGNEEIARITAPLVMEGITKGLAQYDSALPGRIKDIRVRGL